MSLRRELIPFQLVILITTWDEPTDDVIVDTLSAITVSTGSQDFDKKNSKLARSYSSSDESEDEKGA